MNVMTEEKTTSAQPSTTDSPLAIASMVCGVLSLIGFGGLLGVPAVILGIIALNRHHTGKGLSIAGIVTGAISTVITVVVVGIVVLILLTAPEPAPNSTPSTPNQPVQPYTPSQT